MSSATPALAATNPCAAQLTAVSASSDQCDTNSDRQRICQRLRQRLRQCDTNPDRQRILQRLRHPDPDADADADHYLAQPQPQPHQHKP